MQYDFLILGASGMQGRIVSRYLLEHGHSVFLSSRSREALLSDSFRKNGEAPFQPVDLRDMDATVKLIKTVQPGVVINCAEGDWNLSVYEACLETGTHVIDLGSEIPMTKKQLAMHEDFEKKDVTAITGCGSTPGINNVMAEYASKLFDKIETIELGFAWNSNIKKFVVPFSIQSIIEEFTDPAPAIVDGVWVEKKPLETTTQRVFREVGQQSIFIVRHPETLTFYERYGAKGLKNLNFYAGFPAHSTNVITTLIDIGFGGKTPIHVQEGVRAAPIDMLTAVLHNLPKPEGYRENENLWVALSGSKGGLKSEVLMECIVHTLPHWEDAGSNIDTGFPAAIIARMILDGRTDRSGSYAPEQIVPAEEFFEELRLAQLEIYLNGEILQSKSGTAAHGPAMGMSSES